MTSGGKKKPASKNSSSAILLSNLIGRKFQRNNFDTVLPRNWGYCACHTVNPSFVSIQLCSNGSGMRLEYFKSAEDTFSEYLAQNFWAFNVSIAITLEIGGTLTLLPNRRHSAWDHAGHARVFLAFRPRFVTPMWKGNWLVSVSFMVLILSVGII